MDVMTGVPPHWGPVRIFLDGPPFWVVVVACVLAVRGWRVRQPGRITLLQLALFPLLVFAWHAWRLASAGTATGSMMLAWLAGLVVGAWLGRGLVQGMRIEPDGPHGLLLHSGDRSWLPLALGFFVFEFLAVRVLAWDTGLQADPVFLSGYAAVAGLFAGLFVGRLEGLSRRYRDARQRGITASPRPRPQARADASSTAVGEGGGDGTATRERTQETPAGSSSRGASRSREQGGDAEGTGWESAGSDSSSDGGGDGGGGGD